MTNIIQRSIGLLRRLAFGKSATSIYLSDRFPNECIGRKSYGGITILRYDSAQNLRIGAFCSFAADVTIFLGGEHRVDWISTYPFNILDQRYSNIKGHPHSKGDVEIGNDVWVGRGAAILSGVRIGNGAVVGAYALVTKDVPAYGIVAGNPATLLRLRFSEEVIGELESICWWNWPDERLARAVPYLQSNRMEEFLTLVRTGQL